MIHALPGMGADRRMFPGAWFNLPEFVGHNWIHHSGEVTIPQMAKSICDALQIKDGDTLVGCSLGGMVACEITKLREISALYLVGSAVRKEELSGVLALLYPLVRVAPITRLRAAAGRFPSEFMQMFSTSETTFLRAMCPAIFRWEGLTGSATKVYRIHGKKDRIIPAPRGVDLLLDGGHLISMTHAQQCAAYVGMQQARLAGG